jgi:surface antigen
MDLFSTAELRKVIVDSRPPVQYFLDRLYKEQMEFTTEEIMFDDLKLGRRMAPFVAPNLQGRVQKRSGFYTRSFRPAYVKPKDVVTPGRMLRRLAGEALTGDMTPGERWRATVAAYQLDQRKQIMRRWEWMAAQAALYGQVTISGEDYPTVTIDFGRSANHTVVLTGTARWSDTANSNPADDLEDWATRIREAEGFVVTRVTMGGAAWRAFRKHPVIEKLLETRRGSTSTAETGPGLGESVEFKGQIGSFNIYVYADVYEDEDGAIQQMMDSRDVLLEAEAGYEGVRAFGAIMDAKAGLQPYDIFPKMWENEDPSVIYLLSQSAPLMIPSRPNCTLRARVVS